MTDRPIIFSGPMVRALIDGRKTMTRRVVKLPTKSLSGGPIYEHPKMGGWEPTTIGGGGCFTIGKGGEKIPAPEEVAIWHRTCGTCIAARYQAGDRLWVRERGWIAPSKTAFAPFVGNEGSAPLSPTGIAYKVCPSIHMPREVSRLTLIVRTVKIERLHDISHEDAASEGASSDNGPGTMAGFIDIWKKINGPDSWGENPYVVAISFSVEKKNIATLPKAIAA